MKTELPLVSFEATMRCNLRCRFCYNHHKNSGEHPLLYSYAQTKKTLLQIFKVFKVRQITFTGGEPFMAERFGELVLAARFKGASVGVISNGNFASVDNYLQLVDLGVKLFELPIHSCNSEIHDFMTTVDGSHQKSLTIIKSLIEHGVTPTVVIVLTKYNADTAAETVSFIHSLGISRIMLNRYNIGGEGVNNPSDVLPTKTQLQTAFKEISQEAQKSKITILSSVCTPHCVLDPRDYPGIQFSSCSFDISHRPVTIDYMGNVRFCNHSPVVLGNIFADSPNTIFSNPSATEWGRVVPDFCRRCARLANCKAGCRAANQQCGIGLDKPDPVVEYYGGNILQF
ncbi:MAG: radical SAM protein [Bacteroidales bacterium]|nr:radical SAM protein [Bacteroidales bacterium]